MKKILTAVLCAAVALSMTVTAFGAETAPAPDQSGSSSLDLSGLGDALSDLVSSISDALPEIVDSVKSALPEIVDSVKGALETGSEGLSDDSDAIGSAVGQISGAIGDVVGGAAGNNTLGAASGGIAGGIGQAIGEEESEPAANDDIEEPLKGLSDKLYGIFGAAGISDSTNDAAADTVADAATDAAADTATDAAADAAGMENAFDQGMIVGGWKVNTEIKSQLTKEEEEIFQKAETTLAGGAYKPVAVVAEQLVSGMNYAYLCLGAPDDTDDIASWYIVSLYKDLQGNVTTMSIKDIELDDIETIGNVYNPSFVGSWTVKKPDETFAPVLPEDAQAAFDAAIKTYVGVGYTPVALLGTQLVSGLNYKVLCCGTLVTKDPVTSLYVLDIYQDLNGNSSITDAQLFDLNDYISYGGDDVYDVDDYDDVIDD